MDAGFSSTLQISARLRNINVGLQTELSQRQVELASGKKFDPGLELGALSAQLVQIKRQIETIDNTKTTNGLLANRMEVMQEGLGGMVSTAQTFVEQMLAVQNSQLSRDSTEHLAQSLLEQFAGFANASFRGEYVFSGINTDIEALPEYNTSPASPAKAAVEAAFVTEFGFSISDPLTATIDGTQIRAFLDGAFADLFDDANWQALWTGASTRNMRLKYSVSQVAEIPVNADQTAFREATASIVAVLEFAGSPMSENTLNEVAEYAVEKSAQSIAGFASLQGSLGILEQRTSDALERMQFQENLLKNGVAELEDVDPYETATRITELLTKLEASYSVTARIQALTIMNYI